MPVSECNTTFTSLHAFNAAYAYPVIRTGPDDFIIFQYYGISEAIYETPFYWMCADESVRSDCTAPPWRVHRGVRIRASHTRIRGQPGVPER